MIIENVACVEKLLPFVSERLAKALTYLKEKDFSKLSDGRHELDGDDIFVLISSYQTKAKEDNVAEAHFKYIDVQCLLQGQEQIYYAPLYATCQSVKEKNEQEDWVFFTNDIKNENPYVLTQGQVAIFFPWDVHKTKCLVNGKASENRKIVIKVKI